MCDHLSMDQVKEIMQEYGNSKEKLIQILLRLQEASGHNYLPREWVEFVASELDMPISKVYDVITFYDAFETEAQGKYVIEICKSAPCHVNKPQNVIQLFEKNLQIKMGETTKDGLFSLRFSSCFGACHLAPAVKIGEKIYGNLDEKQVAELIQSYRGV